MVAPPLVLSHLGDEGQLHLDTVLVLVRLHGHHLQWQQARAVQLEDSNTARTI